MKSQRTSTIELPGNTTSGRTYTSQNTSKGGLWLGLGFLVLAGSLIAGWLGLRQQERLWTSLDEKALRQASGVLSLLIEEQRSQVKSTVALLSEDARIRAMVLTPTFDEATVMDLLKDIRSSSKASVVAVLSEQGTVRAVVGAKEMLQLNLSSSSLVRRALETPSASVWTFANQVNVLAAAPVRLAQQVHALFVMGFKIDDALFKRMEQNLGVNGGVFVGERMVVTSSDEPQVVRALRAAAETPPGTYRIVNETFLASRSRLGDSAGSTAVAWVISRHGRSEQTALARKLVWLPAVLVGLMVALMTGLALTQKHSIGSN